MGDKGGRNLSLGCPADGCHPIPCLETAVNDNAGSLKALHTQPKPAGALDSQTCNNKFPALSPLAPRLCEAPADAPWTLLEGDAQDQEGHRKMAAHSTAIPRGSVLALGTTFHRGLGTPLTCLA